MLKALISQYKLNTLEIKKIVDLRKRATLVKKILTMKMITEVKKEDCKHQTHLKRNLKSGR